MQDLINEARELLDEIQGYELTALDEGSKKALQALTSRLHMVAFGIDNTAAQTLTMDQATIIDDVQAAWAIYAKKRGRNPDAKVWVSHMGMFEADGINLGKTLPDALAWLRQDS